MSLCCQQRETMSDQAVCPIRYPRNASQPQLKDIPHPHNNDVLSGRGNFVNYHVGNEFFRALVRKHKGAYVACPKAQKARFSRMIVDEVRNQNPSGRFLKQDPKTELWYDTGDKKALDKTRQALREGAPVLLKELNPSDDEAEDVYIQGDSIGAVVRIYICIIFHPSRRICTMIYVEIKTKYEIWVDTRQ